MIDSSRTSVAPSSTPPWPAHARLSRQESSASSRGQCHRSPQRAISPCWASVRALARLPSRSHGSPGPTARSALRRPRQDESVSSSSAPGVPGSAERHRDPRPWRIRRCPTSWCSTRAVPWEVRVVDFAGRPVSGATVTMAALRGSIERMTRLATDWDLRLRGCPERGGRLRVARRRSRPARGADNDVGARGEGKPASTPTLPRNAATLDVHVRDDRGHPVDAAQYLGRLGGPHESRS